MGFSHIRWKSEGQTGWSADIFSICYNKQKYFRRDVIMLRQIISLFFIPLLLGTFSHADVTMHKKKPKPIPVHPIIPDKPIDRPIGVRPIVNTGVVYQDNYYHNVNSCESYQKQIDDLNAYIDGLEAELAELKEKEHARLREKLKKENDEELKKFENRKSSVKTTNSIEIKAK